MNYKGKSILFISPAFFGYEKSIKKYLTDSGAKVYFFDDRPSNSFLIKGLIRLYKGSISHFINKYYNAIYSEIKSHKFDYFFVLNPEALPLWFVKKLRYEKSSTKFILYMWDSMRNKENAKKYLNYFDAVYSFDRTDSEEIPRLTFLPLFYLEEYSALSSMKQFKYDCCFIGTAHSDRYALIKRIQNQLNLKGVSSYWYLYLQSKKMFIWQKLTNRYFKSARMSDFHYKPLSKDDVIKKISESRIIIDIQHPEQTGLTMRTIEALGACRKLVTTNPDIIKYDFYKRENIWVLDRQSPNFDESFFKEEYSPIEKEIYEKYSLPYWIDTLFLNESPK